MKNINGYYVPNAKEIRNAIKNARAYGKDTGNYIQLWFNTITGQFEKEEFVDSNSWVNLPDYCYNVGMQYGAEKEDAKMIEKTIKAR